MIKSLSGMYQAREIIIFVGVGEGIVFGQKCTPRHRWAIDTGTYRYVADIRYPILGF
jgi:hypothetical protein